MGRGAEVNLGENPIALSHGRLAACEGRSAKLVLETYTRFGQDAFRRVHGPFAFVLWDPNDRSLVLARDALGERPLYFSTSPDGIAFSSRLRSLASTGFVSPIPSRRAVASLLLTGAVAEPDTLFEGASPLPPGTWLEWREARTRQTRYFEIPLERAKDASSTRQTFEAELERSIRASLDENAAPCVLLGGGPTSRAVATIAARSSGKRLRTFTLGFGEPNGEERAAENVARSLKTDHHEVRLSGPDLTRWVEEAVSAFDQPSAFGLGPALIARAAKDAGFDALIAGTGGAAVLGLSPKAPLFGPLLAASRLSRPALPFLDKAAQALAPLPESSTALLEALRSNGSIERTYAALTSLRTPAEVAALVSPDVRDEAPLVPITVPEDLEPLLWHGHLAPENAYAALLITNHLRDTALRDAAAASLDHGLDLHLPFVDRAFVASALALPRLHKTILPFGLSGSDPHDLPLASWLRGPLRPWASHWLLGEPTQKLPLLSAPDVARSFRAFLDGDPRESASRLFALLSLVIYLHGFS